MIKRKIHDAEAQISQLEMQAEGWKREAARLKAENERLRAALKQINVGEGWAAQIARAALEGGKA